MRCARCGQPIHQISLHGELVWVHDDQGTFSCRDPRTGLLIAQYAQPAIGETPPAIGPSA